MEDQRRGDVVRQVADHAQFLAVRRQAVEVELQRIAGVEGEVRVEAEAHLQQGQQVLVQLDHVQLGAAAEQALGKGALAGADFHHVLARARMDGAQDAVDDTGIVQEVLAETLAGAVLVQLGHRETPGLERQASRLAQGEKDEGAQFTSEHAGRRALSAGL
ncbi:hypothetical protein D3C81_1710000 [compost metagenome]